MRTRWIGPTAVLLFSLTQAAAASCAERFGRPACGQGCHQPAESTVDVSRLPINLDRIQRQLRQSTVRDESDGLNLRYVVDVFGQAPRIELFSGLENALTGPAPYGAPTHQDMLQIMTPQEFSHPPPTSETSFAGSQTKRRRTSRQVACAFFSSLRPRPRSAQSRPGCVAMARDGPRTTRYGGASHDVDVLVTGVGMVATATWCAQALCREHYDLALNLGVCGSFDPFADAGTVVHVVSRPARGARRRGRRDVSLDPRAAPAGRERVAVRQWRAREPGTAGQRHAGQPSRGDRHYREHRARPRSVDCRCRAAIRTAGREHGRRGVHVRVPGPGSAFAQVRAVSNLVAAPQSRSVENGRGHRRALERIDIDVC